MGCSQSKIDNQENVNRCKQRITFMKKSVSVHNALAEAHFAYAASVKSTGAALSGYTQAEVQFSNHLHSTSVASTTLSLAPPQPPRKFSHVKTDFNPTLSWQSESNFNRAKLRPPPPENGGVLSWDFFFSSTENVSGASLADESSRIEREEMQRKVLENQSEIDGGGGGGCKARDVTVAAVEVSKMRSSIKRNVHNEVDDCFLKASKSAHVVSKLLEANNLHSRFKFAHNPGQINHSSRVVSGITWNRSLKGVRIADYYKYDFDSKENETHAIVFDKMLAWEKQLYDEVKVREQMKYEYQKKIDSLNKLKKFGASTDSLDRTKANISHLHTKYVVAMQSIDSTVCEINRLRDEQLYPKLVQLVEGMGVMWENMQKQHDDQLKIVKELRTLEISQSSKETSEQHFKNTQKLHFHAQMWNSEFQKLMIHQKEYVESLNNWLKLNLIPIDNNLSEKVSSPEKIKNPNIQSLLRTWQDHLEKLPEEGAKTAINSFEAVIDTLVRYQFDEMKMKERRDETRRELTRKTRKFEDWFNKQMAKRSPEDAMDLDLGDDKEVIAEQQIVVEALKQRLEEEEEAYRRQCVQVRDKSLMNLNSGLPDVFTAMSEYCRACSHMYRSLNSRSNPSSSN